MRDILFKTEGQVFSYRVAGICVHDGKVLLQTTTGEDRSFDFPGGHVAFGETHAETLIREFKEELGADISVGDLKWVAEIFFPWGDRSCHQLCLYYLVDIVSPETPKDGVFLGTEQMEGRNFELEFHWIPLADARKLELYPVNARELLGKLDGDVQHFVYKEE